MTVRELIALLQKRDEDAEVFLMCQQGWPFEHYVEGVTDREDITRRRSREPDEDDGDETKDDDADRKRDVFIVQGGQARYGMKDAWETAERR